MAKKAKTVFVCTECGNESAVWQGQCSFCGAWNTLVEQKEVTCNKDDSRRRTGATAAPQKLYGVGTAEYTRITSGITELDRVLGGGIVKGSLTLISGEPGIGKSTLILQAANEVAYRNGKVLYISGEESGEQVKLRADRICEKISDNLYIFSETNIESVISACEKMEPEFVIIDSIQTMYTEESESAPGSVSQIRTCSNLLMKFAKEKGIPLFIVAHVNKSGDLAGPKTIEHMVDTVLFFGGERDGELRILRSLKNRFGTTEEIGAFRMGRAGMEEVTNLAGSLIENIDMTEEGSVVSAVYEGSRPVFFEIQALATPANVGFARRTSVGIDSNRVSMILAVLEKKAGISLLNHDVYVNVVGGVKPDSTSTDLAVALAIYSSYSGRKSKKRITAIGEVGLTGRLRAVKNADRIINEAVKLGYEAIIVPKNTTIPNSTGKCNDKIEILFAENIKDAVKYFIGQR